MDLQWRECFAGIYSAADIGATAPRQAAQFRLSENLLFFQSLTAGHPQLVQRTVERRGRSSCQEIYFRLFRFGRSFSYSPEKGLNHNGFVKTRRRSTRFQAPSANQIR